MASIHTIGQLGVLAYRTKKKSMHWFDHLFGFSEGNYTETAKRFSLADDTITSLENKATYTIGTFSAPSVQELKNQVEDKVPGVSGELSLGLCYGDISAFLGDEDNRFATFQVASQFNCLEFISPSVKPEDGISMYSMDRTQGPACAIACGPATVYRNYLMPLTKQGDLTTPEKAHGIGQTRNRQLNTIREFLEYLIGGDEEISDEVDMDNGYLLASSDALERINERIKVCDREKLKSLLRVGLHSDVQVTATNWGREPVEDPGHLVTQVFGSACPVSYNRNPMALWEPLATLVLEASYEAAMYAAVQNRVNHMDEEGSRMVYLTALGGGAFGNSMRWIATAMERALDKFRDYDLDVNIVSFAAPADAHIAKMIKKFGQSSPPPTKKAKKGAEESQ